jgi:hypothetical protein
LAAKQILFDSILVILLGVLVAWVYRTEGQGRSRVRAAA